MSQPKYLYFDYAAATPLAPEVLGAMTPYLTDNFYNPSASYLPAVKVAQDLDGARASIALILGAKQSEIIFTAGATEANNLAIQGVMNQFPGSNIITSSIEHESVLRPAEVYDRRELPVSADGIVDISKISQVVDDKTVLVSVMYANNEIGSVQPISALSREVRSLRRQRLESGNDLPLYIHTDAAQAAAYLDLHSSRLGVDMMSLNGGKIYGPKQSGVLYINSALKLKPLILGGGQERNIRSGTENVAGAIGMASALSRVQLHRRDEADRLRRLRGIFMDLLEKSPREYFINGSMKHRLPNNVHITIPGTDNERLLYQLEQQGILCAAGSACSASDLEPSHVLRAIGLSDEQARSSLRFSMGEQTDEAAVRQVVKTLNSLSALPLK